MIGKISRGKSFKQALEYAFGKKKKALLVYSNLAEALAAPTNLNPLIQAFTHHAQFHDRTDNPVYKIAISPALQDRLTPIDWGKMCKDLLKHMGLSQHQAIAVVHHDTQFPNTTLARPHMHIIVNLVGDNGRCADLFWRLAQIRNIFATLRTKTKLCFSFA